MLHRACQWENDWGERWLMTRHRSTQKFVGKEIGYPRVYTCVCVCVADCIGWLCTNIFLLVQLYASLCVCVCVCVHLCTFHIIIQYFFVLSVSELHRRVSGNFFKLILIISTCRALKVVCEAYFSSHEIKVFHWLWIAVATTESYFLSIHKAWLPPQG